ncbi:MAG TPA: hypothetical protein VGP48_06745 [Stellaceae bacterium]|jgi:hypothetical protein|nr:hypothetical protein [Stellaceae bacterium]
MDKDLAKDLVRRAFKAMSILGDSLPMLKAHCDETEYRAYLKAIGNTGAAISTEIIHRVFAEHPDIEKEFEARFRSVDRPPSGAS